MRRLVRLSFRPVLFLRLLLSRSGLVLGSVACALLLVPRLGAQGTFEPIILRTGGVDALTTSVCPLSAITPSAPLFEFGMVFGTDEIYGPGQLFDSFSVTVQDDLGRALLLLTADASGVVWAPPNPGGWQLDPGVITHSLLPLPSGLPATAFSSAFQVSLPWPAEFAGHSATLYLDLFSNLDNAQSFAWFQMAAVPEPGCGILVVMGCLAVAIFRRPRP